MSDDTMRDRQPPVLPERADRTARAQIRKAAQPPTADVRKADPDHRGDDPKADRLLLADVLATALVILRIPRLKQQAAFLNRDPRTLRRWFDGRDPIPWEELLVTRRLQRALFRALLERCQPDAVDIRTSISWRDDDEEAEAA